MRVLITGGGGYVGSKLAPALRDDGYRVVVFDTFWFGDRLPSDIVKLTGDIRNTELMRSVLHGVDAVIHLACVSNDPSFELDEELSRTINFECFEPLVVAAKEAGVRRFINCSTSSVYGVSDAPDVREDHPHVPLTLYNTYKSQCEPLLFKHQSDAFECVNVRPSTLCGYAPRQRLDLAVNILTNLAYNTGVITVYGGAQLRPNLHIDDMVDCYRLLLESVTQRVAGQTFNVGAGNVSIIDLARRVRSCVTLHKGTSVRIETQPMQDERSYQVNSDKIRDVLDFSPKRTIEDAVYQLCKAFDANQIPDPMDRDEYYNVRQMKKVFADVYKDAPPSSFDPAKGHLSEIDVMHRGAK